MATVLSNVPLTQSGTILLIATAQGSGPAGWRVNFNGSSWVGSVVLRVNTAPPGQAVSLTSIPYLTADTGATNTAGTAITATGSFIVQPAYCAYDLYAVYTHTSGSCAVTVLTEDAGSGGGSGGQVTASNVDGSGGNNTFGSAVPYTGSYLFPSAVDVAGNFSVATSKLTVNATTGNAVSLGSFKAATGFLANGQVSGTPANSQMMMDFVAGGDNGRLLATNSAGTYTTAIQVVNPLSLQSSLAVTGDLTINTNKFVVTASTGAMAIAGNVTVSGTAANRLVTVQDTTGYALFDASNTSGHFYLGIDTSTGSSFGLGNYARVLSSSGTYPLVLATNGGARLTIDGSTGAATFAGNVGFNGTTAIAKPTVTGSKGANAALASLMTALANYGLVTDSTT